MKRLFIIIFCIFLSGCKLYDEYKMPEDVILTIKKEEISIYDDKIINDLIDEKNVAILNKNKKINTKKIGKQNIIIKYKYKKRTYKFKTYYLVKDITPPIFLSTKSNRYTKLNEEIDLCNEIVVADNYDKNPKCSIEGAYDINKLGKYLLKYKVKDSSNNFKTEDFILNVVENYEDNKSYTKTESTDFSEYLDKYKTDKNELGIDVSAWQGDIDFNKVKEAGCSFVIIRMAYNYKGNLNLDSYFNKNIQKAKEAGLKVGIYIYTTAKTKNEAKEQAKFIVKNLNNQKLDFPIAYDFEDWSNFNEYNLNLYNLYELFLSFSNELNKYNYDAMIYGSKFYLENAWYNTDKHDIWLAHYTDQTNYNGNYKFWQLSNTGRIDGIYGDVDIDIKK